MLRCQHFNKTTGQGKGQEASFKIVDSLELEWMKHEAISRNWRTETNAVTKRRPEE